MRYNKTILKKNTYFDSVTLMSLGGKIRQETDAQEVVVVMATEMNKEILRGVGLATDETDAAAANDLIIAVSAAGQEACEAICELVLQRLTGADTKKTSAGEETYNTVQQAAKAHADANLAVISVPGAYAAREARAALHNGMHVMIFSDNVSIQEELELKELAAEKGLLVMGPDCGTAIINGAGLCFANAVRRGGVGVVGASGTGLQEFTVQVHKAGGGILQAIGVGGRDLSEAIGGIMMLQGIEALLQEPECQVIALVSKPPAPSVAAKIFRLLDEADKPAVVCFLEGDTGRDCRPGMYLYDNLPEAARKAVDLSGVPLTEPMVALPPQRLDEAKASLSPGQRYVRGLFCGGTLCAEALFILRRQLGPIKSNISHRPGEELDGSPYTGNLLLDMGDDEFTNGRPHPMIEPALRNDTIIRQAGDESVGVILLDFELGYGSHADPVGQTLPAIQKAREVAKAQGREIVFVGYVCGTDTDFQGLAAQESALLEQGVILAGSNVEAARIVARILS